MKVLTIKKNGSLFPAYAEDLIKLGKVPEGQAIEVTIRKARNIQFHRKYFALLKLVYESLPEDFSIKANDQTIEIRSVDDLHWHVKFQAGLYDQKVTLGGKITYEAQSISFEKMDGEEFQRFYDSAIDVVCKYFLVGVNQKDLIEMVSEFV